MLQEIVHCPSLLLAPHDKPRALSVANVLFSIKSINGRSLVINYVLKAGHRIEWLKQGITKTIPSFPSCVARAMLTE